MNKSILVLFIVLLGAQWSFAQNIAAEQEIIDHTAILLNRIDLLAEVGGNEVTNPFELTKVYIKQDGNWKLGSLSFTKLMTRDEE